MDMGDVSSPLMIVPAGIEWIFIAIVLIALVFGAKKIPEFARNFGRVSGEYQKAKMGAEKELDQLKGEAFNARSRLEGVAKDLGIDYQNRNSDDLRGDIQRELNKK
jgi:sec-independent protein translocase protein TatA